VLLFIGFNVFNTQIGEQMAVETLNVNKVVGAIIITALAFVFALLGYRLIHVFARWASVLFIVVFVIFGIGLLVAVNLPAGFYSFGTFKGAPFLLEMGIILSYQLTWAPYVSEYSRYLPRSSTTAATFWWTYIGSGIGVLWLAGLGDFLAAAYPKIESSVTAIHVAGNAWFSGWGYIVLLCSFPGIIAVIGMNMYSGALATLTTIDTIKPIKPTLTIRVVALAFVTIAAFVLALTLPGSFLTNFEAYLFIILYFMIPWTAINLIDFFFVRKGNYAIKEIFKPNGMYHRWGWRGLTAYWIAFAAMIPFMSTAVYTGSIASSSALGGADISPFIGFPVAAILYWIFTRNLNVADEKRVAEQQMHEVDPQGAIGLGS
jgi:purine-cytosine permease-like protein